MSEKLSFNGVGELIAHFDKKGKAVENESNIYRSQLMELTGHDLTRPVNALDVIKIVKKVFFPDPPVVASAALTPNDAVYK